MPRTSIMLSIARSNGDSGYPLHVSSMDVTAAATSNVMSESVSYWTSTVSKK